MQKKGVYQLVKSDTPLFQARCAPVGAALSVVIVSFYFMFELLENGEEVAEKFVVGVLFQHMVEQTHTRKIPDSGMKRD